MKGSLRQRSPGSWELTVDTGRDALGKRRRRFLTVRGTKAQVQRNSVSLVSVTPTPTPGADVDALALWDDNGNGRITCDEARRHDISPVRRGHPAYQYMSDRDGDGVVCE